MSPVKVQEPIDLNDQMLVKNLRKISTDDSLEKIDGKEETCNELRSVSVSTEIFDQNSESKFETPWSQAICTTHTDIFSVRMTELNNVVFNIRTDSEGVARKIALQNLRITLASRDDY